MTVSDTPGRAHQDSGESGDSVPPPIQPSFEQIFQEHAPYLWRAAVSLGVLQRDVDDVCQEVWLVVHRRFAEFDGRALRSWLYGICMRVVANYRRSARLRHETVTDQIPERGIDAPQPQQLDAQRAEQRLLSALAQLDDNQREAFVLYEIEELTLKEVAAALDCPLQTAYSRLEAARRAVRAAFAEPGSFASVAAAQRDRSDGA